jgi:predicted hydrocarbon binding protein
MKDNQEIIKKTLFHDNFNFVNGEILIWNVPGMLMTMNAFVLLQEAGKEKFGKEFLDLIYYLGKKQTNEGMKLLHKKYGFKDMKKIVEFELQTASMVGLGICKLKRYNSEEKSAVVEISPNPFVKSYKKVVGQMKEPVDHYSCGSLAGIFSYAFKEDIVGIETNCEITGKQKCVVHLKPRKRWDSKYINSSQFPTEELNFEKIFKKFVL